MIRVSVNCNAVLVIGDVINIDGTIYTPKMLNALKGNHKHAPFVEKLLKVHSSNKDEDWVSLNKKAISDTTIALCLAYQGKLDVDLLPKFSIGTLDRIIVYEKYQLPILELEASEFHPHMIANLCSGDGDLLNKLLSYDDRVINLALVVQGIGINSLINHVDSGVRYSIARRSKTYARKLVNDRCSRVRLAIAECGWFHDKLWKDKSIMVRKVVATNSSYSRHLMDDISIEVRAIVAKTTTDKSILAIMSKDENIDVSTIAKNKLKG